MSKRQAGRLTEQQIRGGGPMEIFGEVAKVHDDAVADASEATFSLLRKTYPELKFRIRASITKREINNKLKSLDARLGKTLFVKEASIKPDGGLIEVLDKEGNWRIILVSEAKYQGKDVENIKAGILVGKNKDQDLMVAGNAIERVHKNINEIRNAMLGELHFPYVVFLQGSNFATDTFEVLRPDGRAVTISHDKGNMNRIDRVSAANYCMKINKNHCKNIIIDVDNKDIMLQAASIYARVEEWTREEMVGIMVDIVETSLSVLSEELAWT
jgi:type II restriction enzyme